MEVKSLSFENMEAFVEWKKITEVETKSYYVKKSGNKISSNNEYFYFYCNRSGIFAPRGRGKRVMKSQGSSKCGKVCSSYIKGCQGTTTLHVLVEYCSSHCNHKQEIAHLPIPDNIKDMIAAKLQIGVNEDSILDSLRWRCSEKEIGREHLINKQDILNIKQNLNIGSIQKHLNDQSSMCAWVEELKEQDYNPILLFKPQGCDSSSMEREDFILGFQTEFQRNMLAEHGKHLVCMDATHGTNMYDFNLITLLVMDSLGEGIPVAWAITNRENEVHLTEFLSAIKCKVVSLEPKYFMSDDADQYFNSWCAAFGKKGTKKLLCAWHIDRAWRKGLAKHVPNFTVRSEIYHHLRILLLEQDEITFTCKLQQTVSYLMECEPRFCEYFQKEYASPNRFKMWATFNRLHSGINTNMIVESFHRRLKVCYLNNKRNRRIDMLLNTLIKISRNLVFENLIKTEKGKQTYKIGIINKRHRGAEELTKTGTAYL